MFFKKKKKSVPVALYPGFVKKLLEERVIASQIESCVCCDKQEQPGWAMNLEQYSFRVLHAPLFPGKEVKVCSACKETIEGAKK